MKLRLGQRGLALRKAALAPVLVKQAPGIVLALLHIRLIERVDAKHRACGGSRYLPAKELPAQVQRPRERQMHHRMSSLRQRIEKLVVLDVLGSIQVEMDKDAIVPVHLRPGERLTLHGQDTNTLLARALRDELLQPEAVRADARREHERELVAARPGCLAEDSAEPYTRILGGRDIRTARANHLRGRVEHLLQVHPDERGGNEPEVRERGVAAAYVRAILPHAPEASARSFLSQLSAWVRYSDEVLAHLVVANCSTCLLPEVSVQRVRLNSRAGLARHDKERLRQIYLLLHALNRLAVCGVEHAQLRVAGLGAVGMAEHVRSEARSPHAKHHRIGVALVPDVPRKALQFGALRLHLLDDGQPAEPVRDLLLYLRVVLPEAWVELPEAGAEVLLLELTEALVHRTLQVAELRGLALCHLGHQHLYLLLDDLPQALKRLGERCHSFGLQRVCYVLYGDAEVFELLHHDVRLVNILIYRALHPSVVAESVNGGGRHSVDGVWPDQGVNVQYVRVGRILRAR